MICSCNANGSQGAKVLQGSTATYNLRTMKIFQAVLCLGLLLACASSGMACSEMNCGDGFNLEAVCAWQFGDKCNGVTNGGGAYDWKARVRGEGERGLDLQGYLNANSGRIIADCLPRARGTVVLRPTCGNTRDKYCWKITATVC